MFPVCAVLCAWKAYNLFLQFPQHSPNPEPRFLLTVELAPMLRALRSNATFSPNFFLALMQDSFLRTLGPNRYNQQQLSTINQVNVFPPVGQYPPFILFFPSDLSLPSIPLVQIE